MDLTQAKIAEEERKSKKKLYSSTYEDKTESKQASKPPVSKKSKPEAEIIEQKIEE